MRVNNYELNLSLFRYLQLLFVYYYFNVAVNPELSFPTTDFSLPGQETSQIVAWSNSYLDLFFKNFIIVFKNDLSKGCESKVYYKGRKNILYSLKSLNTSTELICEECQ